MNSVARQISEACATSAIAKLSFMLWNTFENFPNHMGDFFTENQKISKWQPHEVSDMILTLESLYSDTWNLRCQRLIHWQCNNLARWYTGKKFPPLPDCQKAFLYNNLWFIHCDTTKKSTNHETLCYIISSIFNFLVSCGLKHSIQFSTLRSSPTALLPQYGQISTWYKRFSNSN